MSNEEDLKQFVTANPLLKDMLYEADAWYILSARHGLVAPDQPLEPYEQTLNTMQRHERQRWAALVWWAIVVVADVGDRLIFLAVQRYRELVAPVLSGLGYRIEAPMLGLGIGQQLAWLDRQSRGGERGHPRCRESIFVCPSSIREIGSDNHTLSLSTPPDLPV